MACGLKAQCVLEALALLLGYSGREFELHRPVACSPRLALLGDPSLRARVQLSQPLKPKRATLMGDPF